MEFLLKCFVGIRIVLAYLLTKSVPEEQLLWKLVNLYAYDIWYFKIHS